MSPRKWMYPCSIFLVAAVLVPFTSVVVEAGKKRNKASAADRKVEAKCGTCKALTAKFYEKYKDTDTIHFTGESKGWTLDNEKFMGKYKMGEARLVEILEGVCSKSDEKCFELLTDVEEDIEQWWEARESEGHDFTGLEKHICVEKTKACCPSGHFGPGCKACPGAGKKGGKTCKGHGTCNGDGQRTGSGKCKCDEGWGGKSCFKCKSDYYLSVTEQASENADSDTGSDVDQQQSCEKCDLACKGCTGPGAANCAECAKGYQESTVNDGLDAPEFDGTGSCVDIDECAATDDPCGTLNKAAFEAQGDENSTATPRFCRNKPGSFECADCSPACVPLDPSEEQAASCTGPHPADCKECAAGWEASETGGCKDVDECAAGHQCDDGHYCQNTDGSVSCLKCDVLCSDKGCTSGGSSGCVECKQGYERFEEKADGFCNDIDECKSFPCAGGETCTNSEGSFSCECKAPATKTEEGNCNNELTNVGSVTAVTADMIATHESALETKKSLSGDVKLGSSEAPIKTRNINLPGDWAGKGAVVAKIVGKDVCCGDHFNFSYYGLSDEGFTLVASRVDAQSGWGQDLHVEWQVYSATEDRDTTDPSVTDTDSAGASESKAESIPKDEL